jgi:hypothetical protein
LPGSLADDDGNAIYKHASKTGTAGVFLGQDQRLGEKDLCPAKFSCLFDDEADGLYANHLRVSSAAVLR